MIDVMLVEDDPGFARRFVEAIAMSTSVRLTRTCHGVKDALEHLATEQPDVLLVDLGLPDGNGIEVIRHAVARYPSCDVLVVSVYGDKTNVPKRVPAATC